MFAEAPAETSVDELSAFDLIYLSGITLAILDSVQRQIVYDAMQHLADGRIIVFDPNFRAVLWPSAEEARQASKIMGKTATTVLCRYLSVSAVTALFGQVVRKFGAACRKRL